MSKRPSPQQEGTEKRTKRLTAKQQFALDEFKRRKNLLITGPAGVGKSFLLSEIVAAAKDAKKSVAITATTGKAASILSGCTIYNWAGLGLMKEEAETLRDRIMKRPEYYDQWYNVDVLIIDEVSMMDRHLFEKMDQVFKYVRNTPHPFGGVQMIFVGDFFQLPPVQNYESSKKYVFQSDMWNRSEITTVELTEVMRQNDAAFVKLLNEARYGNMSMESHNKLRERVGKPIKNLPKGVVPTKLRTTNASVDALNERHLAKLPGPTAEYTAHYEVVGGDDDLDEKTLMQAINSIPASSVLKLRKGAQVMLCQNLDVMDGLYNGAIGIVEDFWENDTGRFVRACFTNNNVVTVKDHTWTQSVYVKKGRRRIQRHINVTQLPFKLAWGITVHKSQGQTIEFAEIDLGERMFAKGQGYVALSRGVCLDQIRILNYDIGAFEADPVVKSFYNSTCVQ